MARLADFFKEETEADREAMRRMIKNRENCSGCSHCIYDDTYYDEPYYCNNFEKYIDELDTENCKHYE